MYKQTKKQQRHEPWRNRERHYCSICNSWMGWDRASILLHENGKKHQENLRLQQSNQRRTAVEQQQQAASIQQSLKQMEQAAQEKSFSQDLPYFMHSNSGVNISSVPVNASNYENVYAQNSSRPIVIPTNAPSSGVHLHRGSNVNTSQSTKNDQQTKDSGVVFNINNKSKREEKQNWEARKRQRQEEQERKRSGDDNQKDSQDAPIDNHNTIHKESLAEIPEDGHYTVQLVGTHQQTNSSTSDSPANTYLEGTVYGKAVLEEDMPIQLWVGPFYATAAEKRLLSNHHFWKDAIVIAVLNRRRAEPDSPLATATVVHVSYLKQKTKNSDEQEEEETVEKNVSLDRVRIQLHHPHDSRIPETVHEANLMVCGGKTSLTTTSDGNNETNDFNLNPVTTIPDEDGNNGNNSKRNVALGSGEQNDDNDDDDDDGGQISSWSTVSVTQTTRRLEEKLERQRERQQREQQRQQQQDQAKRQKEMQQRALEDEQRHNDDSALGAYNVWNQGGYKGVEIFSTSTVQQPDGEGMEGTRTADVPTRSNVDAPKKAAIFKKKKKGGQQEQQKRNLRKTYADDE